MSLKIKELTPKVTVKLSSKIQEQIKYLCTKISEVEWSGIIFYTIEGDIENPEELVILPQEILPLDKGTAGFTKYEFGLPVINFMEKHGAMEKDWLIGHIHSHNNMAVFFSSTDQDELRDNAPNHRFYFSIIVNNRGDMEAKVAIHSSTEIEDENIEYFAVNAKGDKYTVTSEKLELSKELLYTYDCNIEREFNTEITEDFEDLVKNINSHVQTLPRQTWSEHNQESYEVSRFQDLNDDDDDDTYKSTYKSSEKSTPLSRKPVNKITLRDFCPSLLTCGFEDVPQGLKTYEDYFKYMEENELDYRTTPIYIKNALDTFIEESFYDYNSFPAFTLESILGELRAVENKFEKEQEMDYIKAITKAVKGFYSKTLPKHYKQKYENS